MAKWILLLLLTGSAFAEDLTTTEGHVYRNFKITRVEPNGLRITHSDGSGKVLFSNLPPDLQKKYGYDEQRAKEYSKSEDAAKKSKIASDLAALDAQAKAGGASQAAKPAAKTPAVANAPSDAPTLADLQALAGSVNLQEAVRKTSIQAATVRDRKNPSTVEKERLKRLEDSKNYTKDPQMVAAWKAAKEKALDLIKKSENASITGWLTLFSQAADNARFDQSGDFARNAAELDRRLATW